MASGGLRVPVSAGARVALGLIPVVVVLAAWWWLTRGERVEDRIVTSIILPSPAEVVQSFPSLWFERALSRNVLVSLGRVLAGFGIAAALAVPLGVAMGAFGRVRAIFEPVAVAGGYLPIAALVPLTLVWFGINETQKIGFLAIATFVYLLPLVVQAVDDVDETYLKTASTLGATRSQSVFRVLVPIALGSIYDSLRLGFGIGWTYIILAEVVNAERGVGKLIEVSQKRSELRPHIYIVLAIIVLIGFGADRLLAAIGRRLFPYREISR